MFILIIPAFVASLAAIDAVLSSCPTITATEHVKIKYYNNRNYAEFSCETGYRLQGKKYRRCVNEKWEEPFPVCISSAIQPSCPTITAIEHANIKYYNNRNSAEFSCETGYRLQGARYRRCVNGKWEKPFPECISSGMQYDPISKVACSSLRPPVYGTKQCSLINSNGLTTMRCRFGCKTGYWLRGSRFRLCQPSGYWDGTIPRCVQEEDCAPPAPLQYGTVSNCPQYRRPIVNQRCSFRCNQGYTLHGPSYVVCNSNGTLYNEAWKEVKTTCQDIDECSKEQLNKCSHTCHNILGSYTCSCPSGYVLIDGFKCEGCRKNSYRSSRHNSCIECPENSYTDTGGKTSIRDCLCSPGFKGNPGRGVECKDVDECEMDSFGCSHTCVNTPGSVHCSCPVGFHLDRDNKTCIDIDECKTINGGCQGACHNTLGSFYCSCADGFNASTTDPYACDDIDECAVNNGMCSQKCVNFAGGYYCSCDDGYRMDNTQKSCIAVRCPRVAVPPHSKMSCYKPSKGSTNSDSESENNNRRNEISFYDLNTTCTFKCNKGYKSSVLPGIIKCQDDGNWSGTIPQCISMECSPLVAPENGEVRPASCMKGTSVKAKCYFTCKPGYELEGKRVFTCKNNLSWSYSDIPTCVPTKVSPYITCPEDISEDLPLGNSSFVIKVPTPVTNMEEFEVQPEWIETNKSIEFPFGRTDIEFTVTSDNNTASCNMIVSILDKELPIYEECPESFEVDADGAHGAVVTWDEPIAVDNVGIDSITQTLWPNTTLTPGVHIVEYVAKDPSGNAARCSFEINVIRAQCDAPMGPKNGDPNCMDWPFGKMCQPICDQGFERDPNEPEMYTCNEAGVWNPTNIISDCLPAFSPNSTWSPESGIYETHVGNNSDDTPETNSTDETLTTVDTVLISTQPGGDFEMKQADSIVTLDDYEMQLQNDSLILDAIKNETADDYFINDYDVTESLPKDIRIQNGSNTYLTRRESD